ncbi:MAG: hypothetical protein GXO86_13140, partial [Chlorobi bacterium]|nr:hypothetical protein [Chlorobiota bacterium]
MKKLTFFLFLIIVISLSAQQNNDTVSVDLVLHPGYNWISFPRVEVNDHRPADVVKVLQSIHPFPDFMFLKGLPDRSPIPVFTSFDMSCFAGNLISLENTRGYKLELPKDPRGSKSYILEMQGNLPDPL